MNRKLFWMLVALVGAIPTLAHARGRFLVFPTGTSDTEVQATVGTNPLAFFRAAPKCRKDGEGIFPCAKVARHNLQLVWQGTPDGEGSCLSMPTIVTITVGRHGTDAALGDDCSLRYVKRALEIPPDVFAPTPLTTIDFGDAASGIDFQSKVPLGFKISRLTWQRACVYKCNPDGCYCITRSIACFYYTERWFPGTPAPQLTVDPSGWCNQASVKPGKGWAIVGTNHPYINYQTAPWDLAALDQCGFGKTGAGTHWSQAYTAVQEHLIRAGTCTFGGQQPTGSVYKCDPRFTTTAPQTRL